MESTCRLLLNQTRFMLDKDIDLAFSSILPLLICHTGTHSQSRVGRAHQKTAAILNVASDLVQRLTLEVKVAILKPHAAWLATLVQDICDEKASDIFDWVESSSQLIYSVLSAFKEADRDDILDEFSLKLDVKNIEKKLLNLDVSTTKSKFEDIVVLLKDKVRVGDYQFDDMFFSKS